MITLFQAALDVVSTTLALLSSSLDVSLTLLQPNWYMDALLKLTGCHYILSFLDSIYIYRWSTSSIVPPPRSRYKSASPLANFPRLRFLLHVVTWVADESDRWVITDAAAPLGLPLRSNGGTPSLPATSPGIFVDLQGADLDSKGDWDLSDIPASGIIDVPSSLRRDFSLIQERYDEFSTTRSSMTRSIFRFVLCDLKSWRSSSRLLTLSTSSSSSCPTLTGYVLMRENRRLACICLSEKLQRILLS